MDEDAVEALAAAGSACMRPCAPGRGHRVQHTRVPVREFGQSWRDGTRYLRSGDGFVTSCSSQTIQIGGGLRIETARVQLEQEVEANAGGHAG